MRKFSGKKLYKFPTGHTLRSECEYPYKPPMKGGHRHNAILNAFRRAARRSKNYRKSFRKRIKHGVPDCFVYWEDIPIYDL